MSIDYKGMRGEDPVKFQYDFDGRLILVTVSREAIEDYCSITVDDIYKFVLNNNENKISESLASWLIAEKPTSFNINRTHLAMIMEKYAH